MSKMYVKMSESSTLWICSDGTFYREPYDAPLNGKSRINPERCITTFSLSTKGYCRINVNGTVYLVHRLVAKYFLTDNAGRPQVNHEDGNKLNNDVGNLTWVTNQENRDHAVENNLQARGPRTDLWKTLHQLKEEIIQRSKNGESQRTIARTLGTSQQAISKIIRA